MSQFSQLSARCWPLSHLTVSILFKGEVTCRWGPHPRSLVSCLESAMPGFASPGCQFWWLTGDEFLHLWQWHRNQGQRAARAFVGVTVFCSPCFPPFFLGPPNLHLVSLFCWKSWRWHSPQTHSWCNGSLSSCKDRHPLWPSGPFFLLFLETSNLFLKGTNNKEERDSSKWWWEARLGSSKTPIHLAWPMTRLVRAGSSLGLCGFHGAYAISL